MHRPNFLDQPFFHQCAPRSVQSRAEYASPVVIHTRTRALERLGTVALLAVFAGIGMLLAWRG